MPRETLASLRAEVERLTAELTELRTWQATHICQPPASYWPTSTVGIPPTTTIQPWTNVCAGAAGGNHTLTFPNTAAGNYPAYQISPSAYIGGAAGGAGVPAGLVQCRRGLRVSDYDPAADPVHGSGWNSAERWGGWDWREPSRGAHFRTCSFCGSIHPEDLAAEAADDVCVICGLKGWYARFEANRYAFLPPSAQPEGSTDHQFAPGGWYASWADRKYGWPHKFYVEGLRNREPERLFIISTHKDAAEGPYAPGGEQYKPIQEQMPGYQWVKPSDIPAGTVTDGYRDLGEYDLVGLGKHETHFAKFYTKHLADPRISDEVKDKIARASGLRFTFEGDRVGWEAA